MKSEYPYLRRAIELSREASARGDEPYAALLVDGDGNTIAEAQNTQHSERDCTGHAETNLLREASRRLAFAALARCTLYASGEPCPMCAGAIYWSRVGRVVFALDVQTMHALSGAGTDELLLPCRQVLARGMRRIEVIGPLLQDQAGAVLREHYRRNAGAADHA